MSILKRVLSNFAHFSAENAQNCGWFCAILWRVLRNFAEGFAQFCAVLHILVPKMHKIVEGFAQFCA